MSRVALVVPCYNEARRLALDPFVELCGRHREVDLVLVDDGSDDETLTLLRTLVEKLPGRATVVALARNGGKAAAVRRGVLRALDSGASYVAYWDADLATPLSALPRLVAHLEADPALLVAFGARVKLLGRAIERRPLRHYLGRVFATAASATLGLPVYDTQCGAKVFRATPLTRELFTEPFLSRWIFDVEILARLIRAHAEGRAAAPVGMVYEVPLYEWRDVSGSRVRAWDLPRALWELVMIRRHVLAPRLRHGSMA